MNSEVFTELLKMCTPPFIFIGVLLVIITLRKYLRRRKARKLKYDGKGVMKKTTVYNIGEKYVSGDEYSSGYHLYRLESSDEDGNIYRSENFKNADHGGRTLDDMVVKYDGVVYDLTEKDSAIRQVNENIQRLEMELQNNPGFFKKRELKGDIEAMKKYIDIANEGPIDPYLMCNGHKVSVGDSIDVFVNPDIPKEYYFDLDFTKEN